MPVRILVYDDNQALRQSIETLLELHDDFTLIGALPRADTVEADIRELKPDLVLMDVDMPGVNGVEAVGRIRCLDEKLPVLMLTVFDDNDTIFNAVCAGANGYILKRDAFTEIPDAIRSVLNGGAPMTGSVARKVLQMLLPARPSTVNKPTNLSARETEILRFLVAGYSYKMIAPELRITIDTVRFHIKKIYDKLHVHSATEAVSKAVRNRLVD